ncbi:MAG: hypothetical protein K2X39_04475, partial [Silvanigrellaceae bacterium]|nr:hypothetical protein [Silvanigrellaceae bacterium]
KVAKAVSYVNAGTVEFIMESPEIFYFMEMNTRIQVEHPVTELVTGIDLVQSQLKIAMGEKLPFEQKDITLRGCAIEARINAEDPYHQFCPDPGFISAVEFPSGPGIRVDSHVCANYKIPEFYDSMIAKLIVYGQDRTDALSKLRRALKEFSLVGIKTTIPYHLALLDHKVFRSNVYTTRFVEEHEDLIMKFEEEGKEFSSYEALVAALKHALEEENRHKHPVQSNTETLHVWHLAGR